MAAERPKPARNLAVEVLNRFDPKRNYAGPILNKLLQQTNEKQRTTDLVFGTIRNRSAIDMVITKLAECPVQRVPARLLNIIRIGAYELIYCPATAEYSIVNEAVENAALLMLSCGKSPGIYKTAKSRCRKPMRKESFRKHLRLAANLTSVFCRSQKFRRPTISAPSFRCPNGS